jgi:hypothetical protein
MKNYLEKDSNDDLERRVLSMCRDMKSCNNFVSTDFDRIDDVTIEHDELNEEYKRRGLNFENAKRNAYSYLA